MRTLSTLFTAVACATFLGLAGCAEDGAETGETTEDVEEYDADVTVEGDWEDDDLSDDIEAGAEDVGQTIEEGAEDVGEAIEDGANEVSDVVDDRTEDSN